MKNITLQIEGMSCAGCAANCQKALNRVDGVEKAEVNFLTKKAVIDFDEAKTNLEAIETAINNAGFEVGQEEAKEEVKKNFKNSNLSLLLVFIFTIPLFYISMGSMIGLPYPSFLDMHESPLAFILTQLLLTIPVMIIGRKFYVVGFKNLFRLAPNMDSLVAVGTSAAFLYSIYNSIKILSGTAVDHHLYFESTAVIIALIMFGRYLESNSKNKTGEAIRKLMNLAPKKAIVIRDGEEIEIQVKDIVKGDIIIAKPGETIAVDGVVMEGATSIDESMLTGESIPVDKISGNNVYSATINKNGTIKYRAEKVGNETVLSGIIKLVEEASNSKAPIARMADKVAGVFVPVVMTIALISAVVWLLLGQTIEFALQIFVAVLVIACPCALGLATPTAIIVATGRAAQKGILFKNATALEKLNKVDTIFFDKTGTITQGKPKVTDILTVGISEEELLSIVASAEKPSEHPLAKAILQKAEENKIDITEPEEFKSNTGVGIECRVNGKQVIIGKKNILNGKEVDDKKFLEEGKTLVYVLIDGEYRGIIAIADTIKETAVEVIKELKKLDIKTVMLTGDNQDTGNVIAKEVGIDTVYANLMPSEKLGRINEIKSKGNKVAMVGDGINDAPALANADIGIAIGNGTDIAIESADVVLIKNDLEDVLEAIKISKLTLRNIKQNLFWAFCYNTLSIPIAAGVFYGLGGFLLNPMIAAAAMSLSSVSVVSNALRLRKI